MRFLIHLMALSLAACGAGGGSGTGGTPPQTANTAPMFTSGAAASITENTALSIQVSASDAEGQAVTYSISGGPDASQFALSGSGALTMPAPNFDNPADSDGNNVYLVTLAASDGVATTTQAFALTITNSREGIGVRRISTGFTDPVAMKAIPGDSRLLVAERDGSIWFFDPANGTRTPYVRARPADPISGPQQIGPDGLLGMTPSSTYATDGNIFVALSDPSGNIQIRRLIRSAVLAGVSNNSESVLTLTRSSQPMTPAAWLGIGPDNFVYLATGDAGGANDPDGSAQSDSSFLGKVIRIRPNPDPFAGAAPSYFLFDRIAKGLRQPASAAFVNGDLLIGDRGQSRFGEINRMISTGVGVNFGWPFREGNVTNQAGAPSGLTGPLLQIAFGAAPKQGNAAVIGGVFANSVPELQARLVFADLNGAIWTVPTARLTSGVVLGSADFERRNEDFLPDNGTISGIVAFCAGLNGRNYMLDRDGEIFEIIAG